ncbi:MAG: hypothetical protein ACLR1T_11945 [Evtepia gabavorous]
MAGHPLGFTLGAPSPETIFDVHFERARGDSGAYPAVNRSFARYIRQKYPHIRYLDREDDMGCPACGKPSCPTPPTISKSISARWSAALPDSLGCPPAADLKQRRTPP